jgi:hypothetical protein
MQRDEIQNHGFHLCDLYASEWGEMNMELRNSGKNRVLGLLFCRGRRLLDGE